MTALLLLKCQVILLLSSPTRRFQFPKQTSSFLVIYSRHMAVATVVLGCYKCQMLEDGSVPIEKGISQVARSQLRHLGQAVRRGEGSTLVCYCVHYSKISSFSPCVLAASLQSSRRGKVPAPTRCCLISTV